jgi:predicted Zn-dependent protease with MMP-like domain
MDGLFRAINIQNEQIQNVALEALSEVPALAYSFMPDYIMQVGEITSNFINAKALVQSRQIMLFWTNICQEEKERLKTNQSNNIVTQYKDSLLQIIFQGLCLTEFDDDMVDTEDSVDDIIYTVSRASAHLLLEVASILQDQVLALTLQFASSKLNDGSSW